MGSERESEREEGRESGGGRRAAEGLAGSRLAPAVTEDDLALVCTLVLRLLSIHLVIVYTNKREVTASLVMLSPLGLSVYNYSDNHTWRTAQDEPACQCFDSDDSSAPQREYWRVIASRHSRLAESEYRIDSILDILHSTSLGRSSRGRGDEEASSIVLILRTVGVSVPRSI